MLILQDVASADNLSYTAAMQPLQFRKILEKAELTQTEAGRLIGVTARQMRRYVSGETPVPLVVVLALRYVIDQRQKETKR
jgi:hypothetical protein